ncbi:hypothetical protein ACFVVU_23760 [Kitasatospora sp. NPDC057965]|uniref:hypothetical protein n=1 Tax=Kitasatospora sp. NPDC057965 TaxID=3346291 RepID=UPI0036D8C93B
MIANPDPDETGEGPTLFFTPSGPEWEAALDGVRQAYGTPPTPPDEDWPGSPVLGSPVPGQ